MIGDNDVTAFFSQVNNLERIDRLHQLLFDWIQQKENELESSLVASVHELANRKADRWQFKKGQFRNFIHVGVVPAHPEALRPGDLWVHVGWASNLLNDAWVGVHLAMPNKLVGERIWDIAAPSLDRLVQYEVNWPKIFSDKIQRETRVMGLLDFSNGWDQRVHQIRSHLEAIIERLDQYFVSQTEAPSE